MVKRIMVDKTGERKDRNILRIAFCGDNWELNNIIEYALMIM